MQRNSSNNISCLEDHSYQQPGGVIDFLFVWWMLFTDHPPWVLLNRMSEKLIRSAR